MPITIGNNIASLKATRQLGKTVDEAARVSTRLSSGQRINQASDDAAGLSIASSLNSKSRVYTQAIRNINDAGSVLNVAEGALRALSDIVTRQIELAEQAANGTYSGKQREALEKEANALRKEYNRIIEGTEFNGRKILDGKSPDLWVQQGYGGQEALKVSIGAGVGFAAGDGTFTQTQAGTLIGSSILYQLAAADYNGDGILDLINTDPNVTDLVRLGRGDGTFEAGFKMNRPLNEVLALKERVTFGSAGDFNGDAILDTISGPGIPANVNIIYSQNPAQTQQLSISGTDVAVADLNEDGIDDLVVSAFDYDSLSILYGRGNGSFTTGQTITTSGGPEKPVIGDINGDGRLDILVSNSNSGEFEAFLAQENGTYTLHSSNAHPYSRGNIILGDFNNDGSSDVIITENYSGDYVFYRGNADTSGRQNNFQYAFDFSEPLLARRSLTEAQNTLSRISSGLAHIGASQSRLQSSLAVLGARVLGYKEASSKITDTDIAADAAQLIRLKILTDAGSAVLSQANQQPALALRLLRN